MPLTVTKNAAAIIAIVAGQRPGAVDAGLRLSAGDGGIDVAFVPARQPLDAVIEAGGARVFLDAAVSAQLDGKTLDGQVDDTGSLSFDILG